MNIMKFLSKSMECIQDGQKIQCSWNGEIITKKGQGKE